MEAVHREIVEHAPAKLNLALHVLYRRADGYHELDSLVAFVPQVADVVAVRAAPDWSLEVTGPLAAGAPTDARNLALRAARALTRRWPERFAPVRIRLEKHLPTAAGIGGGSADAAAVIRAMCRLFSFAPPRRELLALALELGADVPVCLRGRAVRMRGIGERLSPFALPEGLRVVMVNPCAQTPTAAVFSRLAEMRRRSGKKAATGLPDDLPRETGAFMVAVQAMRNDLEAAARDMTPEIAECLRALRALPETLLARMSGSGATCFALFPSSRAATTAMKRLRADYPRWWIAAGSLK